MNFSDRGETISCSSLARLAVCPGSFLLSKGLPDSKSEAAEAGNIIHKAVSFMAVGGDPLWAQESLAAYPDLWDTAKKMWGNCKDTAEEFFGVYDGLETWESEKREWILDNNLNPVLSGQPDLVATHPEFDFLLVIDIKSGFHSSEVPSGSANWQLRGLAKILSTRENVEGVYGAICREWACDKPEPIEFGDVDILLWDVYESTDAHEAGLRVSKECRYCPANLNGVCPLKKDQLAMVLKTDLAPTMQDLSDDAIVRILKAKKPAIAVLDAAEDEVRRRKQDGREVAGVVWESGSVRRSIKDVDGLMGAVGVPVPSKVDVKLSDVENAWLKAKGLKSNKDGKDAFSKTFGAYLEFKQDRDSLVV